MSDASACDVLLVDDDPFFRELLAMRLAREQLEVHHAEDGIDALMKLRQKLPQVIVSDLQMPRMSGIEFIKVVRRRFPSLPVIVLSGSSQLEFPVEATPDRCFDKNKRHVPELVQAIRDLARTSPARADFPQVVSTPVRTRPNGAGYFVLTCTDCLRLFEVASTLEHQAVEQTATCVHCEARVPFLIESSMAD